MSYISESVPDLLGGVSQLAPQRRSPNEVESMVNCQLRPAEGVVKRPPTKWIAEVASSAAAYSGAMVHSINKNANDRYWVIVLDGDLKVFNAVTGVEVPVIFPDGKTYLDVVGTPNESFRLATFNDTTVVINRETTVGRSAELSTTRGFEALISVRQTDFAVNYGVIISWGRVPGQFGFDPSRGAEHTTPAQDPALLNELGSDIVASFLAAKMNTVWGTSGTQQLTIRADGSNIILGEGTNFPAGGREDIRIRVHDGLSGQGLNLVHGTVKNLEALPANAPTNFRIKVEGDPTKSLDDVFYEFNGTSWAESTGSNIPIALDDATMPMELVNNPNYVTDILAMTPAATFIANDISEYTAELLQTADGTASTAAQAIVTAAPGANTDRYMDLTEGNGASAVLKIPVRIDESRVEPAGYSLSPLGYYAGDDHSFEVWMDTGGGFNLVRSIPLGRSMTARQVTLQYDLSGVSAGADIRLRLVSAAGNRGAVTLTYDLTPSFELRDAVRVEIPSTHYAPSTALSFTLNGTGFSDTFVAGGTQAAYMTNLKTQIEAYGGTAVTATINTDDQAIIITNDDGTVPTLTAFSFDDNLDLTQQLFNGDVDFTVLGAAVNDTLKNLTDVSEGTITAVAATIITCSAGFSGGVLNLWSGGDKADVQRGTDSFVCRHPTWGKRTVGTEETNKWPSFEDGTINEVAFLKNRLVLLSDENVAMSEVDEFFQFFRSSTIDVLDSDRIDVALSGNKASALHTAFTWNETLLTWSELGQFVVNGEPFLSPNTVRREATTSYINTRKVKPVASERAVYFLTEGNEFCQLWDYKPTSEDATSAEGNRLSVPVPRYMPGTPRSLLAVSDPEVVLVLTATDPEKLYVYTHLTTDQERVMAGWHEWSFAGVTQILGMGSIDNEVSLIFERDDGTVQLEVLDMWELSDQTVDGQTTNGDPATPPVYNPTPLTTRTDDVVTEAADAKISDHTATPTSAGAWLVDPTYDIAGDGGYYIDGTLDQFRALNIVAASIPPFRVNFADPYLAGGGSDLHSYMDVSWSLGGHGVFAELRLHLLASATDAESGLRLKLKDNGTTTVDILLDSSDNSGASNSTEFPTADAVGGIITVAIARSHGGGDVTVKQRYGLRVTDDTIVVYTADAVTGANEVTLYTGTLVTLWKNKYRAGTYSYHGARVTATLFRTAYLDNYFFASGGATPGTTYTTPLGDAAFPVIIGIEDDGTETTMTNNGDGTVSFPVDDKTGVDLVIGLPVASTIELSKMYHRKNFGPFAGQPEMRGATYISLLQLGLLDTTSITLSVDIVGHASFTQTLVEPNSLDAEVFHCRVGGRNNEVTITISDSSATNFKIVGFDWEGTYYNRTRRIS